AAVNPHHSGPVFVWVVPTGEPGRIGCVGFACQGATVNGVHAGALLWHNCYLGATNRHTVQVVVGTPVPRITTGTHIRARLHTRHSITAVHPQLTVIHGRNDQVGTIIAQSVPALNVPRIFVPRYP